MNDNFEKNFSKQISNDFEGQKCFIDKLELDYIEFLENWEDEYKKYYKLFKNNIVDRPNIIRLRKLVFNIEKICKHKFKKNTSLIHINIFPEKISTKSPLTILNGEWGSGKTHFINDLLTSIKKEKIKPRIIKKYIYIDSWKYLSSNNLVNDFIVELGKNLVLDSCIKWFKTKKMIKNIFNYVVLPNINKRFGLALPKFSDNNLMVNVYRNITSPTLIIIDNIERLGPSAWEIIRVIQKLSISKNLIFLLSINKDKFNELCGLKDNGYEWNLRKYISIPFYNLKSNLTNLIESYNIPEKYNDLIRKVLTPNVIGISFNIRESEKILQQCGFKKYKRIKFSNKYYLLAMFKKISNEPNENEILNVNVFKDVIKGIISEDVNNFYEDYILKILKINNIYCESSMSNNYGPFMSNNFIRFDLTNRANIAPEYRFLSTEFKKYINKFINTLSNIKNLDLTLPDQIKNDILKINNLIYKLKNDPELEEINNMSYIIYKKFSRKNNLSDLEKKLYTNYYEDLIQELYDIS